MPAQRSPQSNTNTAPAFPGASIGNTGPALRGGASALTLSRRVALTAALSLIASGCFGEFAATRALYKWNAGVSDSKWLRWLVFLVLAILPVYGLFILADAIVINTIEFFSGTNPVSGSHLALSNGNTLTSTRTNDPNLIKHEEHKDGKVVRTFYVRRVNEHELVLLDEKMRVLSRVQVKQRLATVYDGHGRVLASLDADQVDRAVAALKAGMPATDAVSAELDASVLASIPA
jgi:hypothetical protein